MGLRKDADNHEGIRQEGTIMDASAKAHDQNIGAIAGIHIPGFRAQRTFGGDGGAEGQHFLHRRDRKDHQHQENYQGRKAADRAASANAAAAPTCWLR